MDNMVLPEASKPFEPAKYICWPAATRINHDSKQLGIPDPVEPEGMWIVDVFIKTEGKGNTEHLCYYNPRSKQIHSLDGCMHKFYGPIPGTIKPKVEPKEKCSRCDQDQHDYCGLCGKNLCYNCMAHGCCGMEPAVEGSELENES